MLDLFAVGAVGGICWTVSRQWWGSLSQHLQSRAAKRPTASIEHTHDIKESSRVAGVADPSAQPPSSKATVPRACVGAAAAAALAAGLLLHHKRRSRKGKGLPKRYLNAIFGIKKFKICALHAPPASGSGHDTSTNTRHVT
jgi:hypothetical protein